jgi:membrane-associated protein
MGLSLAVADAGSGLSWLYLTVFLLVAADAILPLIPGETALIAAGALASGAGSELSGGRPSLFLLVAVAAVGAWLGDNLAYSLGWRAGPYAVVRLLGPRRGPVLYLKADRALATRGAAVLIAARFVPGARTATTIAAGVVGYPRRRFRWTIAVADTCWAVYVGLLGYLGGRTFEDNLLAGVAAGLGAALVFALGLEMVRQLRRHRAAARGGSAPAADRPADLARVGDPSGAAADHELVQQLLAGPGHRVDGGIEHSRVVRSGGPKAGDLPDVLEGSGPDVVVGDRLGEGRAQGLDAAAHAAQSAPAVVRQNQHRAGSAHHLPCG